MDQEAMVMKERKVRLSWRAAALGAGIGLLTMICACAAGAALLAAPRRGSRMPDGAAERGRSVGRGGDRSH